MVSCKSRWRQGTKPNHGGRGYRSKVKSEERKSHGRNIFANIFLPWDLLTSSCGEV
jgi:hypothetical protein